MIDTMEAALLPVSPICRFLSISAPAYPLGQGHTIAQCESFFLLKVPSLLLIKYCAIRTSSVFGIALRKKSMIMKMLHPVVPKRALNPVIPLWLRLSLPIAVLAAFLSLFSFLFLNQWKMDLTLSGEAVQTIEAGSEYQDPGAEAVLYGSRFFRDGVSVPVSVSGGIDPRRLGENQITYKARKLFWSARLQRTVIVQDTVAPVITLEQSPEGSPPPTQPYIEEGFTAYDSFEGDLTEKVTRREEDGVIYYTVSDSSGNETTVHRDILCDTTPPELTLLGSSTVTMDAGEPYEEPGWTAVDRFDGDLAEMVSVKGSVDIYASGSYTLTYEVADSAGNSTSLQREVIVQPKPQSDVVTPSGKIIYLTFDDGPGPHTRRLLDILKKYNVKATFFTCNTGYTSLIADEYNEGHSVAIHSASHIYSKIYASKAAYFADLQKQSDIIYNKTGIRTTLVRFPGGSSNTVSRKYCSGIMTALSRSLTDQGYQYFDWNVLSGDAGETESTDEVYRNVIRGVQRQDVSVVLQHDIMGFSVDAVERIIIWGLKNGYTFLPLDATSPAPHQTIAN